MELSNVSIDGLNILLNSNIVSEENFDELLSSCIALTTGKFNKKLTAGIAYGNVVGLFVEAARHRFDSENFNNFLRTSKIFGGPRTEKLSIAYEEQRDQLICHLANIGNNPSCIVDVNWKLDYCTLRNTNNFIANCVYNINIMVKKYGTLNCIEFTCTRHQLQEFVSKLKDVVRHMEKLSHT